MVCVYIIMSVACLNLGHLYTSPEKLYCHQQFLILVWVSGNHQSTVYPYPFAVCSGRAWYRVCHGIAFTCFGAFCVLLLQGVLLKSATFMLHWFWGDKGVFVRSSISWWLLGYLGHSHFFFHFFISEREKTPQGTCHSQEMPLSAFWSWFPIWLWFQWCSRLSGLAVAPFQADPPHWL